MCILNSEKEMFALIKAQRNLEAKIAKRILDNVPDMRPMEALEIAEKVTRGE